MAPALKSKVVVTTWTWAAEPSEREMLGSSGFGARYLLLTGRTSCGQGQRPHQITWRQVSGKGSCLYFGCMRMAVCKALISKFCRGCPILNLNISAWKEIGLKRFRCPPRDKTISRESANVQNLTANKNPGTLLTPYNNYAPHHISVL